MNARERTEKFESEFLSKYATKSSKTLGREKEEKLCELRTEFQRDRDRILHCKAFRRLKHKTQVFLAPEGDHYRTRLTHTLEVAQIARTIARALALNEDLTEAIALGHDLGHTPFGHAGEHALNEIMPKGFLHYEQSVRVVEKLEKNGKGLNLTQEVKDGILCHTTGREAMTLEGRIVKLADRIAFVNHDIDDAIRAGILLKENLPQCSKEVLGETRSQRINTLVYSVVKNSGENYIKMDEKVQRAFDILYRYMYDVVYVDARAKYEEKKIPKIINLLFEYFKINPYRLASEYINIANEEGVERATCDYIASMSDQFAIKIFKDIYIPKEWGLNN